MGYVLQNGNRVYFGDKAIEIKHACSKNKIPEGLINREFISVLLKVLDNEKITDSDFEKVFGRNVNKHQAMGLMKLVSSFYKSSIKEDKSDHNRINHQLTLYMNSHRGVPKQFKEIVTHVLKLHPIVKRFLTGDESTANFYFNKLKNDLPKFLDLEHIKEYALSIKAGLKSTT